MAQGFVMIPISSDQHYDVSVTGNVPRSKDYDAGVPGNIPNPSL